MAAFDTPAQAVLRAVGNTRAIREWISWQIDKGKTDEQIAKALPLAAAYITGRISTSELVALGRRSSA